MNFKLTVIVFCLASQVTVAKRTKELDYASLEKDYSNLVYNESYKNFAKAEKQIAKKSVEALINGKVKRKGRELAVYLARHNIAYARLVAEEQWTKQEIQKRSK